jgi:hypothetical protein
MKEIKGLMHKLGLYLLVVVIGGLVLVYAANQNNFEEELYRERLSQVQANDLVATQVFQLEEEPSFEDYQQLVAGALSKYEENRQLLGEMATMPGIPDDFKQLAERINEYTQLRIAMFSRMKANIEKETPVIDAAVEEIATQINALDIYQAGSQAQASEAN